MGGDIDPPGVLDQAVIDLDEHRRLASPNGVKPKKSGHGLSLPIVMNVRDHMLGAIAPVAGSDTGRRGQGVAGPAYPQLAQRQWRAGIDMPARFQFGKTAGLQSPEDCYPRAENGLSRTPLGLVFSECLIQTEPRGFVTPGQKTVCAGPPWGWFSANV